MSLDPAAAYTGLPEFVDPELPLQYTCELNLLLDLMLAEEAGHRHTLHRLQTLYDRYYG